MREDFAADCILHQPVSGLRHTPGKCTNYARVAAASASAATPGALVMNAPKTNITTINKVTCFQCFENMVFDLNSSCSNVHSMLDSSIFVGNELNKC